MREVSPGWLGLFLGCIVIIVLDDVFPDLGVY